MSAYREIASLSEFLDLMRDEGFDKASRDHIVSIVEAEVAAQREADAKACEQLADNMEKYVLTPEGYLRRAAAAIRRGEPERGGE